MTPNEKSYSDALDRSIYNFTNVLRTLALQDVDEAARQYRVALRSLEFAVEGARSTNVNVNLEPEKVQRIAEITVDIENAIDKQRAAGWKDLVAALKGLLAAVISFAGLPVPEVLRIPSSSTTLRIGRR